jgi:ATP-binding cassette subfamily F protein 3
LEHQLADAAIYEESEKARLKRALERKILVDKALDEAETAWMEAEEKIEKAD